MNLRKQNCIMMKQMSLNSEKSQSGMLVPSCQVNCQDRGLDLQAGLSLLCRCSITFCIAVEGVGQHKDMGGLLTTGGHDFLIHFAGVDMCTLSCLCRFMQCSCCAFMLLQWKDRNCLIAGQSAKQLQRDIPHLLKQQTACTCVHNLGTLTLKTGFCFGSCYDMMGRCFSRVRGPV